MATKTDTDIIVKPTPGLMPEQAREARAHVWAFVFRCYESKKNPAAGKGGRGDSDGTETKRDSACASIMR